MDNKVSNNEVEIDLKVISSAAEPDWADNWNFRSYLIHNVDSTAIDNKALEIYRDVSSKIDCTSCGNCCREIYPLMTPEDVQLMANGLQISEAGLLKKTKPEDSKCVSFRELPCPMLKENKCTVYEYRPRDCREYPHLDKPDFIGGSIGTIENYGTCPIIYNVYNRLKTAFNYDPSKDYIGNTDPEADFQASKE